MSYSGGINGTLKSKYNGTYTSASSGGGGGGETCRWVAKLAMGTVAIFNELNFVLSPERVKISIGVVFKTTAPQCTILSLYTVNTGSARIMVSIKDGFIFLETAGFTLVSGAIPVSDGEWHTAFIDMDLTTGRYNLNIDGTLDGTGVHVKPEKLVGTFNVTIGARRDTKHTNCKSFLNGVVSACQIGLEYESELLTYLDDGYETDPDIKYTSSNGSGVGIMDTATATTWRRDCSATRTITKP